MLRHRYFTLALQLLIVVASMGCVAAFISMRAAGDARTTIADRRMQSYRLAVELRQSSDDLTRMVRLYAVTGDTRYRRFYDIVLAIRQGTLPRPCDYDRIYWDLVDADNPGPVPAALDTGAYFRSLRKRRPDGPAVALETLMRQAGFSAAEFDKLRQAQTQSDRLAKFELSMMAALPAAAVGRGALSLHDPRYQDAKRAIMQPLDDFFVLVERRTTAEVASAEARLRLAAAVFACHVLGLVLIAATLIWRERRRTLSQLGTTPYHLEQLLAGIAEGRTEALATAGKGDAGSVLNHVHLTAQRLRELMADRESLEQQVQVRSTELRRVMEQLVRTETMAAQGALIAGIAHELNTPLGNAGMAASTLSDRLAQFRGAFDNQSLRKSVVADYVAAATTACVLLERNVGRAADLICSFKEASIDPASMCRHHFDLKTLVQEVLQARIPLYRNKAVALRCEIPDGIDLDSFPGPLERVLADLIDNAVRHALPPDGMLTVEISAAPRADGLINLKVSDDGAGMAPDVADRAFQPFFTARPGQGGPGLGLFMVRQLVYSVLGGMVELRSHPRQGSSFELHLPRTAPLAQAFRMPTPPSFTQ